MAQTTVSIRMDDKLKKDMEVLCEDLGINLTTAFIMFAKKMVREQAIPFDVSKERREQQLERLMLYKEKMSEICKEDCSC
ncbi:MAG: type II toxin-antitoxin system RelB/DinJ family antitoxin [Lachnospiraceae bacterium]|nr:type II toxin-antitoxin system RelB/DinJ family antitoxin [Lachnospiraceae bacterium]